MIYLFAIFASEHGKQLLSRLYVAIFLFYAEKCPKDAEDAEVGELCGSAQPHPVRCSVIRVVHATFYTGNVHRQKSSNKQEFLPTTFKVPVRRKSTSFFPAFFDTE